MSVSVVVGLVNTEVAAGVDTGVDAIPKMSSKFVATGVIVVDAADGGADWVVGAPAVTFELLVGARTGRRGEAVAAVREAGVQRLGTLATVCSNVLADGNTLDTWKAGEADEADVALLNAAAKEVTCGLEAEAEVVAENAGEGADVATGAAGGVNGA